MSARNSATTATPNTISAGQDSSHSNERRQRHQIQPAGHADDEQRQEGAQPGAGGEADAHGHLHSRIAAAWLNVGFHVDLPEVAQPGDDRLDPLAVGLEVEPGQGRFRLLAASARSSCSSARQPSPGLAQLGADLVDLADADRS